MKILVIAPSFPYPLTHGGKIRVFNIIKHLSRKHTITLACLSQDGVVDYGPLSAYCEDIRIVSVKNRWFWDGLRFVLGRDPYNAVRYASGAFRETVKGLLNSGSFDIVQVEFPMMWQYAGFLHAVPVVLDTHNIEYLLIRQMKEASSTVLKKFLYRIEEAKLRRLEHRAWQECDLCVAVSDMDHDVIRPYLQTDRRVITAPNGVDLERFEYAPKTTSDQRILFIGSMDYVPTVDSTRYLLDEIFPLIRSKIPDVKLDIVGRSLWKIDSRSDMEGITLHENVPEIIPFLRKADVLIDPLRIGGGTRLKILEAMAAGVPLITTSKGCEGIEVMDGEHILVADTPVNFSDAAVKLLSDKLASHRLSARARRLVEEHYSWEKIVQRIESAMGELR